MKKFGEGMTERAYVRARLRSACAPAELEGSDGWHDAMIFPAPQHAEYYTGLIDEIARAISLDVPAAEREQARIATHIESVVATLDDVSERLAKTRSAFKSAAERLRLGA